jgi:hypothetical protein
MIACEYIDHQAGFAEGMQMQDIGHLAVNTLAAHDFKPDSTDWWATS